MADVVPHEQRVLACVDQSHFAEYVADYAAWCANRLALPLELLHILQRHPERASGADHSGAIGFQAQDMLLESLVAEDAARNKAAREQGRRFLSGLRSRAMATGIENPSIRQRYGDLESTLVEQEASVELFVLGRRGKSAETSGRDPGRNLEGVVRALHRPILAVSEPFTPPRRIMIAFDGGALTRRGIELVATSPLFRRLSCDIVMAGDQGRRGAASLALAKERLGAAGLETETLLLPGDPEREIAAAMRERSVDLLVMGAYSHSFMHRIFRGSRTADLLRASTVPTLLIR
jgi:nucleotide-binding universal stress UspA family protein